MSKEYKDVKKFVVKRSKWFRGQGDEQSRLQTNNNKMCCLGFYAKECGLKKKHIIDVASPSKIEYDIRILWKSFLFNRKEAELADDLIRISDSNITNDLMEINDSEVISEKIRERQLKDLFKAQGIKLKFID